MTDSSRGVRQIDLATANQDAQANTAFALLESLAHGRKTIDFDSDADYTLSTADREQLAKYLVITDDTSVLTTGRNIIIPATDWIYIVNNETLQTITIKTSGGAGTAIPAGDTVIVVCDGTDSSSISLGTKNNLTATTDPSVNDDIDAGYKAGSFWINTTKNWVWQCIDASAGAADWDLITNHAIPLDTITGSSHTLALADLGEYKRFTHVTNCDFTIPPNSSVDAPVGSWVPFRAGGDGTVTVTAGSGVTINAPTDGTLVVPSSGTAALYKAATDTWDLMGQTVAA